MAKTNYPVGDFLIQLKNAALAGNKLVETDVTKLIKEVAKALKRDGFLEKIDEKEGRIKAHLAYFKKSPVLLGLVLVSKPGSRIYMDVDDLNSHKGPSTYILSTPKGVLTLKEAIKEGTGGEVIVELW